MECEKKCVEEFSRLFIDNWAAADGEESIYIQFMKIWDESFSNLNLPDFSPAFFEPTRPPPHAVSDVVAACCIYCGEKQAKKGEFIGPSANKSMCVCGGTEVAARRIQVYREFMYFFFLVKFLLKSAGVSRLSTARREKNLL